MYNDLNEEQAINLLKVADEESSAIGRYLATKALKSQAQIDHPIGSTLGGIGGSLAGAGIGGVGGGLAGLGLGGLAALTSNYDPEEKVKLMKSLAGGGALLGGGLGAIVGSGAGRNMGAQGFSEKERTKTLKNTSQELKNRPILSNISHSALNQGVLGAFLGGGLGTAMGGMNNFNNPQALKTTLLTTLGGGAAGALSGAVSGGINSLIRKEVSNPSVARAGKMTARHPIGQAMPFGDVISSIDG